MTAEGAEGGEWGAQLMPHGWDADSRGRPPGTNEGVPMIGFPSLHLGSWEDWTVVFLAKKGRQSTNKACGCCMWLCQSQEGNKS